MILLSLNIRGMGGLLKAASFRRLLSLTSPDIIFLQETLVDSKKARAFLNQFHPNWHTCTVNSLGTSGGLAVTWDPTIYDFSPFLCCGGILLSGSSWNNNKSYNLLNVYGPCSDRQLFWEKIEARGLLDLDNLIIAGDLNLTTSVGEVWGEMLPRMLWQIFSLPCSQHTTWWIMSRLLWLLLGGMGEREMTPFLSDSTTFSFLLTSSRQMIESTLG
jgi:hypothetical protein